MAALTLRLTKRRSVSEVFGLIGVDFNGRIRGDGGGAGYSLGSLAECDTQLIIAEQLEYGTYTKKLKAAIMALTMSIRAYGKSPAQP